jgi:hypothetical protein
MDDNTAKGRQMEVPEEVLISMELINMMAIELGERPWSSVSGIIERLNKEVSSNMKPKIWSN